MTLILQLCGLFTSTAGCFKKKRKSGFFKMFMPVSKSSSLAPIPTPRVALKTD